MKKIYALIILLSTLIGPTFGQDQQVEIGPMVKAFQDSPDNAFGFAVSYEKKLGGHWTAGATVDYARDGIYNTITPGGSNASLNSMSILANLNWFPIESLKHIYVGISAGLGLAEINVEGFRSRESSGFAQGVHLGHVFVLNDKFSIDLMSGVYSDDGVVDWYIPVNARFAYKF